GVVHDLALERRHRLEFFTLAGLEHTLRGRRAERRELGALARTPSRDVEHELAALAGRLLHGETGELLQSVENLTVATHQLGQILAAVDAHDCAVTLDI